MNAAASSWWTRTNLTRSWWRRRPSMIPLMPSPGTPKTVSPPQSASRAISSSDAICAMTSPWSVVSADPVGVGVGGPKLQAQPGPVRRRADDPAGGVEGAVKEHRFDPDVVVEPLQVPEVRDGRGGVGVQVRRAVPGDLEPEGSRDGPGPQPLGDAAAAGGIGLQAVHRAGGA